MAIASSAPSVKVPLGLVGATVATRFVGGTAAGAPVSGTFASGDFVIDATGFVWICTVSGTPGTWVSGQASGGVTNANATAIASGAGGVSGDTTVSTNGVVRQMWGFDGSTTIPGKLTLAPASAVDAFLATVSDGTQATSVWISPTHQAASGGMGIHLSRSVTGQSLMVSLESGGAVIWETAALDATTTDLVLAYDPLVGDVLRLRKATAAVSDGANVILGPGIGQPDATIRLDLYSPATDTHTTKLLGLDVVAGSSVTDLVRANVAGAAKWQVLTTGQVGFGRAYGSILVSGAVEAAGHITATAADADVFQAVRRTGTSSQLWLLGIESASSNQWVLKDNATGKRAIIVRPGAADVSLFMDASGGIQLGVAASKLGFYGATAVVKATGTPAAATDLASVIALSNAMRTALINLGLIA